MYLYCLLPLRDILSYCYGAILPICAESAVKPQANKQTNKHVTFNKDVLRIRSVCFINVCLPCLFCLCLRLCVCKQDNLWTGYGQIFCIDFEHPIPNEWLIFECLVYTYAV